MKTINLDIQHALYYAEDGYKSLTDASRAALTTLEEKSGAGNDFLGWVNLPSETETALIERINATAARLRANCDYVVCVGIGGS